MLKKTVFSLVSVLGLMSAQQVLACASCGCTLSSDWENMSYSAHGGFKFDLRYDYIDQDKLINGTKSLSPQAASQISNGGNSQEVEKYTRNTYVTAVADYTNGGDWGIAASLPLIKRQHETLGTASDGVNIGPGGGSYVSDNTSIGDMRLTARYVGFSARHNIGLMLGLKLPTGQTHVTGNSTDPTAPAPVTIDPGLQPGTGTTDLILGGFYTEAINENWGYYTQIMYQRAFAMVNQYRPGDGYNLNLGLRYEGFDSIKPQIQINGRFVRHDTGAIADMVSTGGTLVYLSPGVSIALKNGASLYGFMQFPLYQNVNGVQLTPKMSVSIGSRFSF